MFGKVCNKHKFVYTCYIVLSVLKLIISLGVNELIDKRIPQIFVASYLTWAHYFMARARSIIRRK